MLFIYCSQSITSWLGLENHPVLPASEFYESGAFMLEEEGMVIAGLLVGLNVLDCNMCIKGEDLDQPVSELSPLQPKHCV